MATTAASLDPMTELALLLSGLSGGLASNQNASNATSLSEAIARPSVVGKNASNARKADMTAGYTPPTLQWGGPGSVAKGGAMPTYTGGPGAPSDATKSLDALVSSDALTQAQNNYGMPNPSASSPASDVLGAGAVGTGLLSVLQKAGILGGAGGGPSGGTGAPATASYDANGNLVPSSSTKAPGGPGPQGTPGDLSNVDPNGAVASNPDDIELLLRLLGAGGGVGSDFNHDGQQGSSADTGYQ